MDTTSPTEQPFLIEDELVDEARRLLGDVEEAAVRSERQPAEGADREPARGARRNAARHVRARAGAERGPVGVLRLAPGDPVQRPDPAHLTERRCPGARVA